MSGLHARALACLGWLLAAPCFAEGVTALDVGAAPRASASVPAQACIPTGRRVEYVKVLGRWPGKVALPLAPGDLLTTEKLSAAMEALLAAIDANNTLALGLRSRGEIGVVTIDVEFDCNPPGADGAAAAPTVGVVFHPIQVSVSLERIGNNVIPVPRSALPTFYDNVPPPLLALNPRFGASYDRAFGAALGGAVDADLIGIAQAARGVAPASTAQSLNLHAAGVKAVDGPYYRADGGLRYSFRPTPSWLREASLRWDGAAVLEPQGANEHWRRVNALSAGAAFSLAPTTRLFVDAGVQDTSDSLRPVGAGGGQASNAREISSRLLLDSLPPPVYGFLRAAVWGGRSELTDGGASYKRLVGRIGYAKEIALSPNQTVGLEVQAGAGTLSGAAPAYALFYGGNSPTQFFNDAPSSSAMLAMPGGPLLRSMGQGQAALSAAGGTLVGGKRFTHLNLNLALPVARWSRPLIPNQLTDLEDAQGQPVSLKQVLRRQVDVSGPALLAEALKAQGLPAQEATHEADSAMAEIRPAVHFIIDDANLYSVRPLLMLDAAGLSGGEGVAPARWLGLGVGLAVTVVTARFEVGYMRTVSGPTYNDGRGAFFLRLVFQNLF